MRQKTVDVFHGILNDPLVGCLYAILLTYSCNVLAGYAQLAAVQFQLSWLYIQGGEQFNELLEQHTTP